MWNKKEMSQLDATLTRVPLTFDLENSRSNYISGMGGSIVMKWKGQELLGCSDVKHNHKVTLRQRILLLTGWPKMSAYPSTRLVQAGTKKLFKQKKRDSWKKYDQIHYEILRHLSIETPYIIEHHKWNMEKWHISRIMERSSWVFQCLNLERIILILLNIDILLSQVAYVKLLKEWPINVLCGNWKIMVHWLNNSVVKGQIDRLLII